MPTGLIIETENYSYSKNKTLKIVNKTNKIHTVNKLPIKLKIMYFSNYMINIHYR